MEKKTVKSETINVRISLFTFLERCTGSFGGPAFFSHPSTTHHPSEQSKTFQPHFILTMDNSAEIPIVRVQKDKLVAKSSGWQQLLPKEKNLQKRGIVSLGHCCSAELFNDMVASQRPIFNSLILIVNGNVLQIF